jgi:hypothetical protein
MSRLLAQWLLDFAEFVEGRLAWGEVIRRDRCRTIGRDFGLYFAIGSFLSFITGAVLGFCGVR